MISVRENAEDGCGAVEVSIGQRRLTRIENWHFIQTAAQAEGAEELRQLCGDFIPNCMGFCQGEARHFDGHEAMRKGKEAQVFMTKFAVGRFGFGDDATSGNHICHVIEFRRRLRKYWRVRQCRANVRL